MHSGALHRYLLFNILFSFIIYLSILLAPSARPRGFVEFINPARLWP